MERNAKVTVVKITQTAAKEINFAEKQLYYLVIENEKGREIINVGEKTYSKIQKLTGGK